MQCEGNNCYAMSGIISVLNKTMARQEPKTWRQTRLCLAHPGSVAKWISSGKIREANCKEAGSSQAEEEEKFKVTRKKQNTWIQEQPM